MNGPLDNTTSSCQSCHQTAQAPNSAGLAPLDTQKWDVAKCWFRDLSTQAFGKNPTATSCGDNVGFQSFDFSLQLTVGWRNWVAAHPAPAAPGAAPHLAPQAAPAPGEMLQPKMLNNGMSQPIVR
jgi:hypothetical protein